MKLNVIILFAIFTLFGCEKNNNENYQISTIDYRYINTNDLIICMLENDIELKKDSFLIKDEAELINNFRNNICINNIPKINFSDSIIIGYKTEIKGSGITNQRTFTYDSIKNIYTYTITVFENDTSMLNTELNWITILKYDIDSLRFKLNIEKQ